MRTLHVDIVGMTCEHCVRSVRNRLASTPGIQVDEVKIGFADIRQDESAISLDEIEDVISDEGYTVDSISDIGRA